ncbi:hypothetical protein K458DRAFT_422856 [Lentithecium fluviatile CBS 122367]|uniref:Uncharacterized protein n=1 Tax=Lentithecium fluviatile CBS 122367 TaxID=1168545 RepID=A0A6G1IKM0_9PLEO|nr:hypothetical protein K458DRAFT_422856 [Lentithecium fluviatile CBS 122367]
MPRSLSSTFAASAPSPGPMNAPKQTEDSPAYILNLFSESVYDATTALASFVDDLLAFDTSTARKAFEAFYLHANELQGEASRIQSVNTQERKERETRISAVLGKVWFAALWLGIGRLYPGTAFHERFQLDSARLSPTDQHKIKSVLNLLNAFENDGFWFQFRASGVFLPPIPDVDLVEKLTAVALEVPKIDERVTLLRTWLAHHCALAHTASHTSGVPVSSLCIDGFLGSRWLRAKRSSNMPPKTSASKTVGKRARSPSPPPPRTSKRKSRLISASSPSSQPTPSAPTRGKLPRAATPGPSSGKPRKSAAAAKTTPQRAVSKATPAPTSHQSSISRLSSIEDLASSSTAGATASTRTSLSANSPAPKAGKAKGKSRISQNNTDVENPLEEPGEQPPSTQVQETPQQPPATPSVERPQPSIEASTSIVSDEQADQNWASGCEKLRELEEKCDKAERNLVSCEGVRNDCVQEAREKLNEHNSSKDSDGPTAFAFLEPALNEALEKTEANIKELETYHDRISVPPGSVLSLLFEGARKMVAVVYEQINSQKKKKESLEGLIAKGKKADMELGIAQSNKRVTIRLYTEERNRMADRLALYRRQFDLALVGRVKREIVDDPLVVEDE